MHVHKQLREPWLLVSSPFATLSPPSMHTAMEVGDEYQLVAFNAQLEGLSPSEQHMVLESP